MSETVNEQFRGREGILSVKEGNSEEKGHKRPEHKEEKRNCDRYDAETVRDMPVVV